MTLTTSLLLVLTLGFAVIDGASVGLRRSAQQRKNTERPLGIINGTDTDIKDAPFMASVEVLGWMMGSGVVLNKRWILTTGFVLILTDPKHVYTRVGSNKWITGGRQLATAEVHVHPNYTGTWDWDIALVKTLHDIEFGPKVQPATLATKPPKAGTKVTIAGWGTDHHEYRSKHLESSILTILGTKACAKDYPNDYTDNMFCTANNNYTSPTSGDFGDPVYVNNTVYGLYIGSIYGAPGGGPQLYCNIAQLYTWVQSTMGGEE